MTEMQHQQTVFKWTKQPSVREKYPELKLLYHIANERYCSEIMGRQLKLAGVKKGVPDMFLPVARGEYNGLFIELKTDVGTTTPEQEWWGEELLKQGYFWEICHGWESAVRVLEWYLNLKKPNHHQWEAGQ